MNLCNNKLMLLLSAVVAVELIGIAAAGVYFSKEKRELTRQREALSRLEGRRTFPALENVKAVQDYVDGLAYRVGEYGAELRQDPFPREAVEAAEFSARAQDVIERFVQRATAAGIELPSSTEAGFSKYASGGAVPDVRDVPRLTRQLYSVERVADVLVQSGVVSIEGLSRETFEEQQHPEDRSGRRSRRPRPGSNDRKPQPLAASEVDPEGLYFVEKIGVRFSAKESEIWRVLDLFASSAHFMAVAEFSHKSKSEILSYNPDRVKRGDEDDTIRWLSEGILVGETALSRPERIIAGNELVQVSLVVDVYNFDPGEVVR